MTFNMTINIKVKIFSYTIFLNGKAYKIYTKTYCNLNSIINYLNYKQELSILEINGQIHNEIKKNFYLKNKDQLELITVVGGG